MAGLGKLGCHWLSQLGDTTCSQHTAVAHVQFVAHPCVLNTLPVCPHIALCHPHTVCVTHTSSTGRLPSPRPCPCGVRCRCGWPPLTQHSQVWVCWWCVGGVCARTVGCMQLHVVTGCVCCLGGPLLCGFLAPQHHPHTSCHMKASSHPQPHMSVSACACTHMPPSSGLKQQLPEGYLRGKLETVLAASLPPVAASLANIMM